MPNSPAGAGAGSHGAPRPTPQPGLHRFALFAVVGTAGFAVDTGALALLHYGAGMDPFSARAISTPLAMLATWRLNRVLTFGASAARQLTEGARYLTVATIAALLNYAIYSAILLTFPIVPPPIAVAIATLIVMTGSYLGYSRLVFSSPGSSGEEAGPSATKGGGSSSQSR